MKNPPSSRIVFLPLLLAALAIPAPPSWAAAPPPETAAELFRTAHRRAAAPPSATTLRVESEASYTLRFSERPGSREIFTRWLDLVGLAGTPRPPFWWPEARVHWGEHLWDGRVESFGPGGPVSLLDPGRYRLTHTEEAEARGKDALRLVFAGTEGLDRVTVTVNRRTFEPFRVEQVLLRPVNAYGTRLAEYRLTLSLASRGGYWLVAQGDETYRFTSPEGEREVAHSWKSLSWRELPDARRAELRTDDGAGGQ